MKEVESSLLGKGRDGIGWDGVDEVGETNFLLDDLLAGLALVNSFLELLWVFVEEKEGKSCYEFLLAGSAYFDSEFLFLYNVLEHLNWFPAVLVALVDRGECVGLTNFGLAFFDPLIVCLIFIPSVISCEYFDSGHIGFIEDVILFVEQSDGLLRGLIFVYTGLGFV